MELFLRELGLNVYESRVYESLVKIGKGSATKLSALSGVPYGRIYDVLESLVSKGLVRLLPEKTKHFVPADPDKILSLVKEKQVLLQHAEQYIGNLKKFYDLGVTEPVLIASGKKNFYALQKEMKEAEKVHYTIRYNVEVRPDWVAKEKAKIRRGVDMKNLARYDQETKKNVSKWVHATGKRWKAFPNEGVAVSLKDDREILISLIKSNVSLLIRDKPFIDLMKTLFLSYWEKEKFIEK
ncbi:MAG: helix-turn-helix domain-containing protein [Nanoarchaeota archaeon]|nr:helix-turn-helix domain-containing protein [Nanoarchaeota archaeon]